ncbi:MAG: hypothetical protein ACREO3_07090, partial [Arenimonas sp.]
MRWLSPRLLKVIGAGLFAASIAGFIVVADDWRHTGEFSTVVAVLVSGIALFVAGRYPGVAAHVSLAVVPIGIGVGLAVGAAFD